MHESHARIGSAARTLLVVALLALVWLVTASTADAASVSSDHGQASQGD
jgi:hypothetical protein